jgi:hypothetical protein
MKLATFLKRLKTNQIPGVWLWAIILSLICFSIWTLNAQNIIVNGDLETAEPFFWHTMNAGDGNSVLSWTDEDAYQEFRSFKISKPNTGSAAVGWISENNAQRYWNRMEDNITYELSSWIRTSGVNTSPASDDERIGLLFQFFDAGNSLIADTFVTADQSATNNDWHQVSGSVYIPAGSVPDSMICIAQFGKDATGTAWFDYIEVWSDPWTAWMFGSDTETPAGWLKWSNWWSSNGVAMYDNSNAYSGTYSAKLEEIDNDNDEIVFYSIPAAVVPETEYHLSARIKTGGVNTDPGFTPTTVITDRLDARIAICFFFHEPPIDSQWVLVSPGDLFFYIDQTIASHDWRQYEAIRKAPPAAAGVSMRARFTSFPTGTAWFDDFSIREVFNDSIIVIFPNGGENLYGGNDYEITWTSTQSIDSVKIEYSTDAGSTWSPIAPATLNDGAYTWNVPDTPSNNCLVKISDAADGDPYDISNENFTIVPSPISVTFRLNAATVPDTVGPNAVVQVRGSVPPLSWNSSTEGNMTHIGGDYWEATVPFPENTDIEYKFFVNASGDAGGNGWETDLGNPGTINRLLTTSSSDTTLPLQFFNTTQGNDQFFIPYVSTDSFDVYFRVNMQANSLFDSSTQAIMVKVWTALSGY